MKVFKVGREIQVNPRWKGVLVSEEQLKAEEERREEPPRQHRGH